MTEIMPRLPRLEPSPDEATEKRRVGAACRVAYELARLSAVDRRNVLDGLWHTFCLVCGDHQHRREGDEPHSPATCPHRPDKEPRAW